MFIQDLIYSIRTQNTITYRKPPTYNVQDSRKIFVPLRRSLTTIKKKNVFRSVKA